MNQRLLKLSRVALLSAACVMSTHVHAQLGKCKGKYLGNITQNSTTSGAGIKFTEYWNQVTAENASKWESVERTKGTYVWTDSDLAYNWAKNNNGIFKYHTFVWGQQAPGWVNNASVADIRVAVENYIKACSTHYTPMGGLRMIDVLNEPVNTAFSDNYKAALTAGYQAEPANANDKNNQYGWAIWPFQLARKYFPNAVLLINEYNTEMNWNNCRAPYLAITNAVKNAPNLTDGKKNLIDGVGLQCHGVDNLTATNFKSYLDEIWTKTGLPIHISEFDQEANPNEDKQKTVYATLIPIAWEHPHVAGITLWGYVQGKTWRNGNGTAGASGTDSGIMYANGTERPALTWLKTYMAGRPSLPCCPAPAPFANCVTGNVPTATLTAPTQDESFAVGATITLTATAADIDGNVTKVEFYRGTTKIGEDATSPYTIDWNNAAEGYYTLTAVATDNEGNTGTSSDVKITVGNPSVELLENSEFDNSTTGWTIQNNNSAVGTITVVTSAAMSGDNALKLCPTTPGTADWHVQLQQAAPLQIGKSYELSFMAKADAARTIGTGVQQNADPYTMYFSQATSLTTVNQTFTYNFTSTVTDEGARLKFFVGNNSSCVYLDKVSLKQIVVTSVDDATKNNSIAVYPNPFTEQVSVEMPGAFGYRIYNASGMELSSGQATDRLTLGEALNKGIYILKLSQNNTTKVVKVSKQ